MAVLPMEGRAPIIIRCFRLNPPPSIPSKRSNPVEIPLGMKAVQFVPRIVDITPIEICTDTTFDDFYSDFEFSNRGEGAFGSTGV